MHRTTRPEQPSKARLLYAMANTQRLVRSHCGTYGFNFSTQKNKIMAAGNKKSTDITRQ